MESKMIKLSKEQIKDIAEELDMGMSCYVHKTTGDATSIPAHVDEDDDNFEPWEDDFKKVEQNPDQYILIETMHSSDSFKIMRKFLGKVADPKLRDKLMIAISQNKPFRRFRDILDYSGDVLQDWYQFKQEEMERYVERHLRDFSSEEE